MSRRARRLFEAGRNARLQGGRTLRRVVSVRWSFRMARILGIEVRLHLTFLLLMAFYAWKGWATSGQASGALVGVLLPATIFGCVLLHEFGHVLMARRFGIRTRDVTLLPIGGVARLESTGETPRQELAIALAGPAVNLVIALVAGLLVLLMRLPTTPIDPATGAGSFATWLIVSNLFLLGFNLIPAFPMDGGRVLRALLSMKGDRVWATRIAATVGQGLAVVLALAGMLALHQPMLLFIALFVWMGASQEAEAVSTSAHLDGVPVRKAMMTEFRTVSPFDTLGEVSQWVLAGFQHDFPVTSGGELVGLLLRDDLFPALRERGPEVLVGEVMRRGFAVAAPDEPVERMLRRSQFEDGPSSIPVLEGGRLVGLVTAENVGEYVMLSAALAGRRR